MSPREEMIDAAIFASHMTPTVVVISLVLVVLLIAYLRRRDRRRARPVIVSRQSGNWSDPNTWKYSGGRWTIGGVVPGAGDSVVIRDGHTVTVDCNNADVGTSIRGDL
jgi:hypothetical protein